MKPIIFAALAALGVAGAPGASAQTVPYNAASVSWENATENTDVPPGLLPVAPPEVPDALARTDIYRSVCNSDGTAGVTLETISVPVPGGPLVVLFQNLPDGTVQCFRARHFTFAGVQSGLSATVSKTITPPVLPKKPKPPRNPKVLP